MVVTSLSVPNFRKLLPLGSRFPGVAAACNSVVLLILEPFLPKKKGNKVQSLPHEREVKKPPPLLIIKIYSDLFPAFPHPPSKTSKQKAVSGSDVCYGNTLAEWSAAQDWIPEETFDVDLIVTRIWKSPNEHVG